MYCSDGRGHKTRDILLVGHSLGGNIIGNYIGEEGDKCFVTAACLVQPPYRLWLCRTKMETSLLGAYNYFIGKVIMQKLQPHMDYLKERVMVSHNLDLEAKLKICKNFIHFDTHITTALFNYGTIENFYDKASCHRNLPKVRIPTLILMANDDPLVGGNNIDYEVCNHNPYLLLGVT